MAKRPYAGPMWAFSTRSTGGARRGRAVRFRLLELAASISAACPCSSARNARRDYWATEDIGMVISTHSDENGAVIFRQACRTGLDGIVSKRLTAPCRGPTTDWLKIKKRTVRRWSGSGAEKIPQPDGVPDTPAGQVGDA